MNMVVEKSVELLRQAPKVAQELVSNARPSNLKTISKLSAGMSPSAGDIMKAKKLEADVVQLTGCNVPLLDPNSEAAKFFGVTGVDALFNRLGAQVQLGVLKSHDENFLNYLTRNRWDIDNPTNLIKGNFDLWYKLNPEINNLWEKGAARFTVQSKMFGIGEQSGYHTIGLVADKETKNLYVLDSFCELVPEIKRFHNILKSQIFTPPFHPKGFKEIIFSSKPQQRPGEYSCNNWAIANIEALRNALKNNQKITNSKELNAVLPDDINKILEEQYKYVLNKTSAKEAKLYGI